MEFILAAANASLRREEISILLFFFFSSFPFLLLFPFFVVTSYARNQPNRIGQCIVSRRKTACAMDRIEIRWKEEEEGMFSSSFSVNDTTYRDTTRRKNERRKNDDRSIDAFRKPLNRHQPYPIVQPSSPFSLFPLRVESPREDRKNLERGSAARVVEYLFKPRFQPPAPEEVGDRWKCIRPPRTCGMQNKNVQR